VKDKVLFNRTAFSGSNTRKRARPETPTKAFYTIIANVQPPQAFERNINKKKKEEMIINQKKVVKRVSKYSSLASQISNSIESSSSDDSLTSIKSNSVKNFDVAKLIKRPEKRSSVFIMKAKDGEKDSTESIDFDSARTNSQESFQRRINDTFVQLPNDRKRRESLDELLSKLKAFNKQQAHAAKHVQP